MPNTNEMRYKDPSVGAAESLQTAANTEVRYLLMEPEHSSCIRAQLFQHLRVVVSPSSLPPTELNIGVESALSEGHMWPHSQLIRGVHFFFFKLWVQPRAGSKQKLQIRRKVVLCWLAGPVPHQIGDDDTWESNVVELWIEGHLAVREEETMLTKVHPLPTWH